VSETSAESLEPGSTGTPTFVTVPKPSLWQRWQAWRFDIWAWRRKKIREEDGLHKTWPAEARAVKSIWGFIRFHDKLMNGYNHDYGTICHAVAALGVAGTCLANHNRVNGGVTGYQASAIMWEWLNGWGTGPKNIGRMLDYEDMLYPQYEKKFNQLSRSAWAFLQEKAAKSLAENPDASPRVRAHWQTIVDGNIPFGWGLEPTNEE
jgi:hypothetical protein